MTESGLPLNLAWGATVRQMEEMGLVLTELKHLRSGTRAWYVIPRETGKQPIYCAMVTVDDAIGLVHITWNYENIEEDPFGHQGVSSYAVLQKYFNEKYGAPFLDVDWIEDRLLGTAAFYNCLSGKPRRCAELRSAWITQDMSINLYLSGINSTGQLSVKYRHKELFDSTELSRYKKKYGHLPVAEHGTE
jgi:hypothetical protein